MPMGMARVTTGFSRQAHPALMSCGRGQDRRHRPSAAVLPVDRTAARCLRSAAGAGRVPGAPGKERPRCVCATIHSMRAGRSDGGSRRTRFREVVPSMAVVRLVDRFLLNGGEGLALVLFLTLELSAGRWRGSFERRMEAIVHERRYFR